MADYSAAQVPSGTVEPANHIRLADRVYALGEVVVSPPEGSVKSYQRQPGRQPRERPRVAASVDVRLGDLADRLWR